MEAIAISFAISFFPISIVMRLWERSISTFIFVVAIFLSSFLASANMCREQDIIVILVFAEILAVFRALVRQKKDHLLPE